MKRLFYICFSIVYLLVLSNKSYSQQWISIDGSQRGKTISSEVIESNSTSYKVKVKIHGLYDNIIKNEHGLFHLLGFDGGFNLMKTGNPSLPCFTQLIAIPPHSEVSASVIEENWMETEVGTLYPTQNYIDDEQHPKAFQKNENTYKCAFIPNMVTLGEEHRWKGIRNVGISVCPFKYFPTEDKLSVLSSFVLQVCFQRQRPTLLWEDTSGHGLFNNTAYREQSTVQNNLNRDNDEEYNYLIVVGNPSYLNNSVFVESLNKFRLWKALKGYKTKVVSTNDTGFYPYSIKEFIQGERNKCLQYVLFVGDSDWIPLSSVNSFYGSGSISGDYWYGCDTNSDMADIAIGRFSISSISDFVNMVEKTIKYEYTHNYNDRTLLVAHRDPAYGYKGCCESIKNAFYTSCDMSFHTAYGGDSATNADVIAHINEGDGIINYRGHGGSYFWGDGDYAPYTWNNSGESFESSQINNMDSTTCSVFFSIACNTGDIANDSVSMLEAFTRSDHGAVAFVGSTYSSKTLANNEYDVLLFQKLLNDGVRNLGRLNLDAHNINFSLHPTEDDYELIAKNNAFSYICGGDPSLEIWTSYPASPQNVSVTSANGYITVNTGVTGNYYIAIASGDGQRIDSIGCSSPTCTFPIPNTGKFFFAINKPCYRPYVIYYDSESEYIQNVVFNYDAYYVCTPCYNNDYFPLEIGEGISATSPGEVIVKSGRKLVIKNGPGGVYIDTGFLCEKGAVFEVK